MNDELQAQRDGVTSPSEKKAQATEKAPPEAADMSVEDAQAAIDKLVVQPQPAPSSKSDPVKKEN